VRAACRRYRTFHHEPKRQQAPALHTLREIRQASVALRDAPLTADAPHPPSTPDTRRTKMIRMDGLRKLLATAEPPDLGPGPRAGVRAESTLNKELDELLPASNSDSCLLLRAVVLLWHDHLDAAHTIAQSIENADGAFIHGIMHRREPDYGNATYWFRRVGRHGAFPEIARQAGQFLEAKKDTALHSQLVPAGSWDAYAFIAACEQATQRQPDDARRRVLREVQRIESEALMDWLFKDMEEGQRP
jgi:hypothetical protein